MTLKALKDHFHKSLSDLYSQAEIKTFFNWLIDEFFKLEPIDILLKPELEINNEKISAFEHIIQRLKREEPIQYILGYTEFYGLRFKVNPQVLIPRPETEELVDWIVKDHKSQNQKTLIDIGTGSGCIAIALQKKLPNWNVMALDISTPALDIAKSNADFHKVNIKFIHQDILNTQKLPEQPQVIVSNPPYVQQLEKNQMNNNVLKHEPHQALFVEDTNPLIFYKVISKMAKKLPHAVEIYFEINQYLVDDLKKMLKNLNLNTYQFRKDFRGNMRFLKVLVD